MLVLIYLLLLSVCAVPPRLRFAESNIVHPSRTAKRECNENLRRTFKTCARYEVASAWDFLQIVCSYYYKPYVIC